MRRLMLVLSAVMLADTAGAETSPRCAIVGQMAVSSWLEMLNTVADPKAETLDPIIARVSDLSGIYAQLECNVPMLGAAMDCLLIRSGSTNPQELARSCMSEAGLTMAE